LIKNIDYAKFAIPAVIHNPGAGLGWTMSHNQATFEPREWIIAVVCFRELPTMSVTGRS